MDVMNKVKKLLLEEGKNPEQMSGKSKLLCEILEGEQEIALELTDGQLSELSEELGCPRAYLLGIEPFDDMALLERNKGNVSIHLKFSRRIPKAQQEIFYDLCYVDYLWLVDRYIEKVEDEEEGLTIYYKD